VRRTVILLVLLASALLPSSAFADVPPNDTQGGATTLVPAFAPTSISVTIPPVGPGGWTDATSTDDATATRPSCLGVQGQLPVTRHSMWYRITLAEAGVLTIKLTTGSFQRYQPVVTILNAKNLTELACGLGGSDQLTDTSASASTYAPTGEYLIRIAAVGSNEPAGSASDAPTLSLTESVQDVTPPAIHVSVSGKTRIVGPGVPYTFDATASEDLGSGVDKSTATWWFYEGGQPFEVDAKDLKNPLIVQKHHWDTAGLHQVTLQLSDKSGNTNRYSFYVLVHNFVPPTVGLRVFVPSPGDRRLRVVLTHNVPIRVRLVVLQGGRVLRVIPSKLINGSNARTPLTIALTKKVGKVGFVAVSGVAGDLGQYPNRVPLLTCSVDPVHGGGVCG
jgi:hypothetical protein